MEILSPSTFELLIPLINAIDGSCTISKVTALANKQFTLDCCNTGWATQGFPIIIQTKTYEIISIIPNVSITVQATGTDTPTPCIFALYAPKFYHGTVSSVATDFSVKVNNRLWNSDKLPMIWLHESVDETIKANPKDAIIMNSPVDLYFMIDSNFAEWTNDDHFEQAIKPMRQLADRFFAAMKYQKINDTLITDIRVNDFSRWGATMKDGSSKQIFNQPMSGVKCSLTIPFIRDNQKCC